MEITLEQALAGNRTRIKDNEYLPTSEYILPFIDRMSKYTDKFIINAIQPNQITIDTNNGDNITYNRMWIQAVMPDSGAYQGHDRVCGMVYGLDVRKPIVKFYVGGLNRACCNLCVFSPSFLSVQDLEPEKYIDYRVLDNIMSLTDDVTMKLEKMANTPVEYDQRLINENLGDWIRKSINYSMSSSYNKVKLATSTAIDAYKLLYEKEDSPYYVPKNTTTDMFNIYNAWTQVITDDKKDLINKCEKTILIGQILGV